MNLKLLFASILILAAGVSPAKAGATASWSIYQLNSSWKTQAGKTIHLPELGGKPRIIAMFYSRCPFMCPLIVSEMKRIQASLPPEARKRVGFVLISIDPKHDSANRLENFASEHQLDSTTWTLLSGSRAAVRDLASALGFKYRESNSGFVHRFLISAVDSRGVVQAQLTQKGTVSPAWIRAISLLQ